jgi:DNA-binding transcriptional ArsR family regulator
MKITKITKQLKAAADKTRLRVLVMLNRHPMMVEAMLRKVKMEPTNFSHHLSILKEAGLVTAIRKGKNVLYSIHKECRTGINLGPVKLVIK